MNRITARKNNRKLPILAFIFIALSIPLAIYALINLDSFDTRNRASNDIETNACIIKFPYVNPSSIEQGKIVQVQVDASVPQEKILSVSIMNGTGNEVFKKDYTENLSLISEIFTFTSNSTGDQSMLGTLVTDKGNKPCVMEENRSVTVVASNLAPEFKTLPTSAKPSNAIKVKDNYEYLLRVEDTENDTINYSFSFTPGANWLKYSVIEDGREGKLAIKFTGTPDKPASYLANIFVHDGYNQHLRAQSWVINVDQDVNDVPKVAVYEPNADISIKRGEEVKISWEATDLNQITKYELYISQNPASPNTWIAVDKNLSNKVGSYILDTSGFEPGTYQAIVRATDNYNPPAMGVGVSARIVIDSVIPPKDNDDPDDGVILVDPQIINISPSKGSKLKNKNATVSATLIAGTSAEIDETTVVVYLDDKDVTKDTKINKISKSEYSLIFSTKEKYKVGTHKVNIRFKDTKGGTAQKDWTFDIIEDSTEKSDVFNIFGLEIPKRTALIIGGGLLLVILAILIPWVLYLLWRGSKDDEYETVYNTTYSPIQPDDSDKDDDMKEEKKTEVEIDHQEHKERYSHQPSKELEEIEPTPPTSKDTGKSDMWTPAVLTESKETKIVETPKLEEKPLVATEVTPEVKLEEVVEEVSTPEPSPIVETPMVEPITAPVEETPSPVILDANSEVAAEVIETNEEADEEPAIPGNEDLLNLAKDLETAEIEDNSSDSQKTSQTQA